MQTRRQQQEPFAPSFITSNENYSPHNLPTPLVALLPLFLRPYLSSLPAAGSKLCVTVLPNHLLCETSAPYNIRHACHLFAVI